MRGWKGLIFGIGMCLGLLAAVSPGWTAEGQLTILHTNDLSGRFSQMMKVAALKSQIKGQVGRVILLDAGNAFSADEMAFVHPQHEVSPTIDMMNRAGYDALTLGERGLSLAADERSTVLREAAFPVLGANLHRPQNGRPLFQVQPYAVMRTGGVRVGILGLGTPVAGIAGGDPVTAARYYVPLLRARADVVVLLTHLPAEADSALAAAVPGVDLIIGADAGQTPGGRRDVNGVAICQAGPGGDMAGRVDLDLTSDGVVVRNASLLPLDVSVGSVEDMTAALSLWSLPVAGEPLSVTATLGTSAGGFGAAVGQAGAMGYLVADLMRQATGADVALVSAQSVHPELPEGPIRVMDLFRIYAPDYRAVVVDLKGAELRSLIETGLDDPSAFFYPSGIAAVYAMSRPEGQRLVSLALSDQRPIDSDKTFRVAVEDGVARFQAARGKPGPEIRDLIARHIKQAGVITGKLDNRLQAQ